MSDDTKPKRKPLQSREIVGATIGAVLGAALMRTGTGDLLEGLGRVDPKEDLDRRYTLQDTLTWCKVRARVDAFDLDVAADDESHHAPRWYDAKQDGLKQPWDAPRIWCNPPYSSIEPWVLKAHEVATESRELKRIAMLLPCNRTEQPWWQKFVEPFRDVGPMPTIRTYFLPGRVRFGHPGNPKGHNVGSPPFGCVLLVWGLT